MSPLFWSLASGLAFCLIAWAIGPARKRCDLCDGRGYYEATETFSDYELSRNIRCPRGC